MALLGHGYIVENLVTHGITDKVPYLSEAIT